MEWIDIKTAITLTSKSDKTIRNWAKSNKTNPKAVKKDGKIFLLSAKLLEEDYPFKSSQENFQQEKDAAQLTITAQSLQMHQAELAAKNDEIKILLQRKSKLPAWLSIGFISLIIALLAGLMFAFTSYKHEQSQEHSKELSNIKSALKQEMALKEQIANKALDNKQLTINRLKTENTQQREELAEKDHLISQLYNDTKEQNKKLLKLTESLNQKTPLVEENLKGDQLP